MKNIILSGLCFALFTACTQNTVINPPSPTPTPTASVAINNNPSQVYKYDLPVKFILKAECEPEILKTEYELKDNKFSYNLNTDTYTINPEDAKKDDIKVVDLTQKQIDDLKSLVKTADLANLAKDHKKVPPGTPQTMECRTISGVYINTDGSDKLYQLNDREYIHTEKYRNAYNTLKEGFDKFKDSIVLNNSNTKELNKEFDLKIGETALIKDQSLSLTVNKKTEESRCASDVQCIWAGQVSFELTLDNKGIKENFTLTKRADSEDLSVKKIGDYTIKLVKVLPETFKSDNTPKDSDYILTLKIEK